MRRLADARPDDLLYGARTLQPMFDTAKLRAHSACASFTQGETTGHTHTNQG